LIDNNSAAVTLPAKTIHDFMQSLMFRLIPVDFLGEYNTELVVRVCETLVIGHDHDFAAHVPHTCHFSNA
jgi:hypothetical protein